MDWQEYLHASRRPRLDGEHSHAATLSEEEDAIEAMREEGRRNRAKKLHRGKDGGDTAEMEDVGWEQISDVIGLMAKKTDANTTTRPVVHKKVRASLQMFPSPCFL